MLFNVATGRTLTLSEHKATSPPFAVAHGRSLMVIGFGCQCIWWRRRRGYVDGRPCADHWFHRNVSKRFEKASLLNARQRANAGRRSISAVRSV